MAAHPDATTARTPIGKVLGIALALVAVVAVIVLAFAWPAVTAEPKDLPVAITGPAEAISAAEQAVDAQAEGAIAFVEVDDRAAAVEAIETPRGLRRHRARARARGAHLLGVEPAR